MTTKNELKVRTIRISDAELAKLMKEALRIFENRGLERPPNRGLASRVIRAAIVACGKNPALLENSLLAEGDRPRKPRTETTEKLIPENVAPRRGVGRPIIREN